MNNFNSILNKKLNDYFSVSEYTFEQSLNALSLFIFTIDAEQHDLFILAKILEPDSLERVISYYDGSDIKIPSKDEYKYLKILTACFYMKEILGWKWPEIRELLNLPDDEDQYGSIALGTKIKKLKEEMKPDFFKVLMDVDIFDMKSVMEGFVNEQKRD